jgi:hypothetical protein
MTQIMLSTRKERGSAECVFWVPEKVGPVGVCLHLAKDEGFMQTDIDRPHKQSSHITILYPR